MSCVVTKFVYDNTISLFNFDEQWLRILAVLYYYLILQLSPRFRRIIVSFDDGHEAGWSEPVPTVVEFYARPKKLKAS